MKRRFTIVEHSSNPVGEWFVITILLLWYQCAHLAWQVGVIVNRVHSWLRA